MHVHDRLKIPATSTWILQYTADLYTSPLTSRYLAAMDYSAVGALTADIHEIYPNFRYYVHLRKQSVRHFIGEQLILYPQAQVLLLGSGLDPLGLYLMEHYANDIGPVFEVDNGFIREKQQIYESLTDTSRFRFIHCDLTNLRLLMSLLDDAGFDINRPAVIVFEGVVHYITAEQFHAIMFLFRTTGRHNMVIMDYNLPVEDIAPRYQPGYQKMIGVISEYIKGTFHLYDRAQIKALIASLNGQIYRTEGLHETELRELGKNSRLPREGGGSVEMIAFYL